MSQSADLCTAITDASNVLKLHLGAATPSQWRRYLAFLLE